MLRKHARGNAKKVHFKISQSFIFRRLPEAIGWELLIHHPSPSLKLCIAQSGFLKRIQGGSRREVLPPPRICQLQEAVLHQIRGVYANVVHHVDVLDGLILSLDEGRTVEPVSMALSSEVCELEEERIGKITIRPTYSGVSKVAPPKGKGALPVTSFGFQIQAAQPGMILPPSQKQPPPLQWATWSFQLPSLLPNLPELLTKLATISTLPTNSSGRENKQCLIKRPGEEKAEG